jgi:hypothetical protein
VGFTFRDGKCEKSAIGFIVNIGTSFSGSTKSKLPYFGLFTGKTRPGTYQRQAISFRFAGVTHALFAKLTLNKGLRSGTFSGRDIGKGNVTGSFTC